MGWNIGSVEDKKLRIWEGAWEKWQIKNQFLVIKGLLTLQMKLRKIESIAYIYHE